MKLSISAFLIILMGASSALACVAAGEKDGLPILNHCPNEIVDFINRSINCQHFAGEISGDPTSGRDNEVYKAMAVNKCDQLRYDKKSIYAKYKSDTIVRAVMQQTFKTYEIEP